MKYESHPTAMLFPMMTEEELIELITHLAFYAGWPSAMSAATKAKELFKR